MAHHPQIDFKHVLGELSINKNTPCEVLRELISNSYDAKAENIYYVPLEHEQGFAFIDDGSGLSWNKKTKDITPWEAFFSVGKSTKYQGEGIGYKCQGSKLVLDCSRLLVATKYEENNFGFIVIDNPKTNLNLQSDISPEIVDNNQLVLEKIKDFIDTNNHSGKASYELIKEILNKQVEAGGKYTLILIKKLECSNFSKFFFPSQKNDGSSFVENYIRTTTRHGAVTSLTESQGFSSSDIKKIKEPTKANFFICHNNKLYEVPFGYPYIEDINTTNKPNSPAKTSSLRHGRFYARYTGTFKIGSETYSVILAIDGHRRALEGYPHLGRRGNSGCGIKISEHRGVFIASQGIKIAKFQEILTDIDYEFLTPSDSQAHYFLVIDGNFGLVTNRNSLSEDARQKILAPDFIKGLKTLLKKFSSSTTDQTFKELCSRIKKETSTYDLDSELSKLEEAKKTIPHREKFKVKISNNKEELFVSPIQGEEYLVGVLYATLGKLVSNASPFFQYWKNILTFSTQGVDSIAVRDINIKNPLSKDNIISVEYKFCFSTNDVFNHALASVNYIVAWEVDCTTPIAVHDKFDCAGSLEIDNVHPDTIFHIPEVLSSEGESLNSSIIVICLKELIKKTFNINFIPSPISRKPV